MCQYVRAGTPDWPEELLAPRWRNPQRRPGADPDANLIHDALSRAQVNQAHEACKKARAAQAAG